MHTKFLILPSVVAVLMVDVFYFHQSIVGGLWQQEYIPPTPKSTTSSRRYMLSTMSQSSSPNVSRSRISSMRQESRCQKIFIKTFLIVQALISLSATLMMYNTIFFFRLDIEEVVLLKKSPHFVILISGIAKLICLVPFITYEYYLILFEHVFVDTSHLMPAGMCSNFLTYDRRNSSNSRSI